MGYYPECEKMIKVKEESQNIGEFIDWLYTRYMHIAFYDEEGNLHPALISTEKLLAEYFNIDLDKVEKEKRQMLEELRK